MLERYRDYFDIDPEYFSQVNEAVIEKHPDMWKKYYPHTTFKKLIKDTVSVLSRQQKLSIWVEGAYGTGKSHAVLTLKKLLDANEADTREYFERYDIDNDLFNKFQSMKNSGKILTVHRYGSSSIQGDNDLVLAIQESIEHVFTEAGIENKGSDALKTAVIKYLSDTENKNSFNIYVTGSYSDLFGGDDVDTIIEKLNTFTDLPLHTLMGKIFKVAKERQIKVFTLTITDLCKWIKETIKTNDLKAIVFIWDEFTEFFGNNIRNLTGFQEIAEISATDPFYLMIVTHKSASLFNDADKDKTKILDRFVKPTCIIELPENIAFQLMGAAMEKNKDEQVSADWEITVDDLYDRTKDSRKIVKSSARITDEELKNILPIHPYAALLLKHISSAFDSNQRSMFDFIKNDRGDEIKGFQWFIDNYGPLNENPLLTVDMLWEFFYDMGKEYLSHDIRSILDCYSRSATKQLGENEQRVLKTVLLLQAISQKVGDSVELFIPNDKNINNAFEGSDIDGGAAARCAAKLARDKILYLKPLGGDKFQYSALTGGVDTGKIEEIKDQLRAKPTSTLVMEGNLAETLMLPASLKLRYVLSFTASTDFDSTIKKLRAQEGEYEDKICAVMTFARDDNESVVIGKKIHDAINDGSYNIVFIDATMVPFGKDGFDQYCENKANAIFQTRKDDDQSRTYDSYALQVLKNWKNRIASGEFLIYTKDKPEGERVPNADALFDAMRTINKKKFPDCLEGYNVLDTMYTPSSLKSGVECGAKQETSGTFRSGNSATKLENALDGAWNVEKYWEVKPHILISKIKIAVDKVINDSFRTEGRVSISKIYGMLKAKPYGFMPCNLSAFIMGFILKEYIDGSYTWSDGLTNDALNMLKIKEMIDEVIKLEITPNPRYKDKYIVTITAEEKAFNEATSTAFGISPNLCTSVEQTRERIRGKMKEYSFPIWVLKFILKNEMLKTKTEVVAELIDNYCGIANSNNMDSGKTDNDIALAIGKLCIEYTYAADDLRSLLSKEKCTEGMRAYLDEYNGKILPDLATEVGDNGQYINALRRKFDADAANWVWNIETANQKIKEVIIEYQIIAESNKVIAKNISFDNTIREWCDKCNFIRISYHAAKNYLIEIGPFLDMLYNMKRSGVLLDSQKKNFLDLLVANEENFKNFYNNQVEFFKRVCSYYVEEFSDEEVKELFNTIPTGSFTRDKSEYTNLVASKVDEYKSTLGYVKLKNLWKDKTGTETPREWSKKNKMPILAMIPDKDVQTAKFAFGTLNKAHPDANSISKALDFLQTGTFYDALKSTEARDKAFRDTVIKNFVVMLTDIDEVKDYLDSRMTPDPYDWFGLPEVEKKLQQMAEAKYNQGGCDRALEKIDNMDVSDVKRYLKDLIKDNMIVGIEIIKNN